MEECNRHAQWSLSHIDSISVLPSHSEDSTTKCRQGVRTCRSCTYVNVRTLSILRYLGSDLVTFFVRTVLTCLWLAGETETWFCELAAGQSCMNPGCWRRYSPTHTSKDRWLFLESFIIDLRLEGGSGAQLGYVLLAQVVPGRGYRVSLTLRRSCTFTNRKAKSSWSWISLKPPPPFLPVHPEKLEAILFTVIMLDGSLQAVRLRHRLH